MDLRWERSRAVPAGTRASLSHKRTRRSTAPERHSVHIICSRGGEGIHKIWDGVTLDTFELGQLSADHTSGSSSSSNGIGRVT